MKKVYIAHPLRGAEQTEMDVIAGNIAHVDDVCRKIAEERPDVLILSPIHAFCFVSPLGPQDWVLDQCRHLLNVADEVWVYGDHRNSEGCRMEIEHAQSLGIPVFDKSEDLG